MKSKVKNCVVGCMGLALGLEIGILYGYDAAMRDYIPQSARVVELNDDGNPDLVVSRERLLPLPMIAQPDGSYLSLPEHEKRIREQARQVLDSERLILENRISSEREMIEAKMKDLEEVK